MRVVWRKVRWRCREPRCSRGSFTEAIGEIPAGRRTTGRLRRSIAAAVGDAARSVTEVAAAHGVSWPTAHAAFVEAAEALLGEPEPTSVLGIDETRRGRPRWIQEPDTGRWVRVDPWDTGFVDLAGGQGLLGQVEGRTSAAVVDWLTQRSPAFRDGDPVRGDRPGRRLRQRDPHAGAAAERDHRRRSLPPREAGQRRRHQGPPPGDLGDRGPPRPQGRPRLGEPAPAADRAGTAAAERVRGDVERTDRLRPDRAGPDRLDRQGGTAGPARAGPHPPRPRPDLPPAVRVLPLVRRHRHPRTAHPRHHRRDLVAGHRGVHHHRHHQRVSFTLHLLA